MATSKEFHDYVVDCLLRAADITTRKMMGEYCVYYCGKVVGLMCDDMLLLKKTPTSERLLSDCELTYPYEGSKTLMYITENFEDENLMQEVLDGMYNELPFPKK